MPETLLKYDQARTVMNRENLFKNRNLLYWYEQLYKVQLAGLGDPDNKVILEIGSGTSPLQHFYKHVITSDVMALPYLDHRIDCHAIDQYGNIADGSVDIVSMTNVLHHLQDPLACLKKVAVKLKPGGCVVITEPYFSFVSKIIYKCLHHEPSRFDIDAPILKEVNGPLSSANMAIPYMIFFSDKGWAKELAGTYAFSAEQVVYYTSLSYMVTGGISRRFPVPARFYRYIFALDRYIADKLPHIFSAFFVMKLTKKATG